MSPQEEQAHDDLQIEMAARGCISGRLEEWPHLTAALNRRDLTIGPRALSSWVIDICKSIREPAEAALKHAAAVSPLHDDSAVWDRSSETASPGGVGWVA